MAQLGANVAEMPDSDSLEPLPAGQYHLEITASDVTDPESARGRRVSVEYVVISGPHEGRRGWDRFDIDRVAQTKNGERQIDASRFKQLCSAVGITDHVNDTNELHGIPFLASATIEPANGQYGPKNRWGNYKAAGGAAQSPAPQQARQPAATQQRGGPPVGQANGAGNGGAGRPGWMSRAGVGAR